MTTIHATWSGQLSNFAKKLCIAKILKSTGIEENKNNVENYIPCKIHSTIIVSTEQYLKKSNPALQCYAFHSDFRYCESLFHS